MNASRSKRDTLQKKPESTTKSPNRRASQGRRNASPHSPPPYNLRSGRKLTAKGKSNSKGKSSKSQNKSGSSSKDKHGSSHKKHSITTAEVEETLKDEINHKLGTTSPGRSSPRSDSKNKGHKQTENKSKGKTPNKKTGTPNKPSKSTPRNQERSSTPGSGKKTSLNSKRKSSVSKGPSRSTHKSDVIEEEKVDTSKKSVGKRSSSKTPGKIEEESNKKGKESVGKRSPGRMVDESKKQTPSKTPPRQGKTPSKSKGSKGKSVGKGSASKSPGRMSEESGRKGARNTTPSKATPKRTPSRSNTKKRKAEEISKNPDLGAQGDLQALGGTTIQNELKKVKDNKQDGLGKEHLEKIKIVDLAKKKPSTSTKRQTRASSGKAGKESAEKNKSAEKDRSSSSGKKSKKKVVNGKKKTENEEEANENTVEMKLLEMRAVVKGKGYCIWRKITLIDDIPMTKLARIIVTAMGWLGCWDWKFKLDDKEVLLPPDDDEDREETTRQKFYGDEVTLSKFKVKEGDKFQFIYNPQSKNPWVHDIVVESLDRVQVDKDDNSEKAKMFQHAVVASGSLSVPPDRITPVDFEKICEDFNKGEREFDKWKSQLGDDFNMNTFNKNKINEILKIHMYDEEKMDPKVREGNIFFKW